MIQALAHFNYVAVVAILMGGLFIVFASGNLIKRMIGLAIFQTGAGLLYISLGKAVGGTAPILIDGAGVAANTLREGLDPAYVADNGVGGVVYSNPLPHVLILTAIVVGVATLAVGLAIAVRTREAYGTIEAREIAELDRTDDRPEEDARGAA